jgi:hypothetical protein
MNNYLSIIGVLLLAFVLYMALKPIVFGSDSSEGFEYPGRAPLEIRQASMEKPRTVMPSGPNPPSQAAPEGEVVIHGDAAPTDPFAEQTEASDAPETIRNVERSFRPAPDNNIVGLATSAGIAGETAQSSPQAYQKFGSDFVQNSGEFMTGIYANDTMSDANYSAF